MIVHHQEAALAGRHSLFFDSDRFGLRGPLSMRRTVGKA